MFILLFKVFIWSVQIEKAISATSNQLIRIEQVTIRLKEEVTLERNRVYLSDVGSCLGPEQVCQEAYGIEIANFPPNISNLQINSTKIQQTLENEWPLISITVNGSPSVKIFLKKSLSNNEDALVEKLKKRLEPIKSLGYEIEISKIRLELTDQYSRLEPIGFSDQDLADSEWIQANLNGKKTVNWAAYDESSEEPQYTYQSEVIFELKKFMPSAGKDLTKGSIITQDDIAKILVPLNNSSYINDLTDSDKIAKSLVGRKTKSDVKKDHPLLLRNTELPLAIRKNQSINIVVNGSGLIVGFIGKSLQNGSVGDVIDINYPNSKRVFKARVIDEQNAEMIKSGSLVTNP